jgi:hypothetical protein
MTCTQICWFRPKCSISQLRIRLCGEYLIKKNTANTINMRLRYSSAFSEQEVEYESIKCRAMAQAVSCWPLTTEAPISACGQSGTGTGFLLFFGFPLSISFPLAFHIRILPG